MNSGLIGTQGLWVGAGSLTETQQNRLIRSLEEVRCPLCQGQREDFVAGIVFDVRLFFLSFNTMIAPAGKIDEINAVLRAARGLQEAISKLSIDARLTLGSCAEEIFLENSEDESFDSCQARDFVRWDGFDVRLDGVVDVCDRAATRTVASKQAKISIQATKGLVDSVARRYRGLRGTAPPWSRNCWFHIFMNELCSMVSPGMKCGGDLLKEVIGGL